VLEILDRYVQETVAEQRVEKLRGSMRASRRATSSRRLLAAMLLRAGRRLERPSRRARCPEATAA
jgi:hypothetical protein